MLLEKVAQVQCVGVTCKLPFIAFGRARFDRKLLPYPGLKLAHKGDRSAGAVCSPVHSDHLGIEDVPEDLFHGDLSSIAGAPAQSVGEVVPRAQGQDGHPGDELVLAL